MKLHVHERGAGDKVALLIHGVMSDHGTWHAVEDALVAKGYRVLACDLRGHGLSARGAYSPGLLADDIVENLPADADVAIGHSLGALTLSLAIDRLRPRKAVYCDPAFRLGRIPAGALEGMKAMVATASLDGIRAMNPRWSDADVRAELDGFGRYDIDFLQSVSDFDPTYVPAAPTVPSLVQLADPSFIVDAELAEELRSRGYDVRVVEGTGHCIHRDDFDAFMKSLDGWI
ncbi:alpha/beta fold hydrolase [Embleya sp. NBC_00896]|uniref:alpha/beta fold hydrolase n=1 Tax=Embleya sp. NBC_00896 TaxID=2975961 RepID=UPI00386DD2D6|nr:alpha/beta hydrolase [Embleya sp. NBC_00896]